MTQNNSNPLVAFTMGAKGGPGKTTFICSLVDHFLHEKFPASFIDADIENKSRGSLSYVFKDTPKLNIRTPRGLDNLVDRVLSGGTQTILADLGAGSGQDTFAWFDDMHESLHEMGVRFLAIGVLTNDSATTSPILHWAAALKDRANYLLVRNHVAGDDFGYMFDSEQGKKFLKVAAPAVIDMEKRVPDIQQELNDRGLSLRQALTASNDVLGPILSKDSAKIRMRGYVNRIEREFARVIDTLLPAQTVKA